MKDTKFRERLTLQFRAEIFNLLNRANFNTPSLITFTPSGVSGTAGAITSTTTTSRRIQFGRSVIALLAVVVLRPSATGYALLTQFLVCAAGIMAAVESFQTRKPALAISLMLVAIAFNPLYPLRMPQLLFLGTATVALGIFMLSIVTFRSQPRLSMASITDRRPGSESL